MNISSYFINRPRLAGVLSIFIFLIGLLAIFNLPVSEYPEVAPPQIVVRAQFPGANPRVISETVATPLEEQINGVENLLYFDSQATADGSLTLTVTFKIGTNPEVAETAVQNRINRALPRLPDIVRQIGVTTEKSSPNLTMVVHLVSPDDSRDALYLRNYGQMNVRDELLRIPGMGSVILFGAGDYAMRIWLDPAKLAARNLTTSRSHRRHPRAERAGRSRHRGRVAGAQGHRVPAVGQHPGPAGHRAGVRRHHRARRAATGGMIRIRDLGRVELAANTYSLRSLLNNKEAAAIAVFQAPGSNALALSNEVRATMERLKPGFPQGMDYAIVYDPTRFVQTSIEKVVATLFEAVLLVVLVVIVFLQTWRASLIPLLAVPVSIVGTFAFLLLLGYSINTLTLFGLVLAIGIVVDDAIVVVENVERNIEAGLSPHDATVKAMHEVSGPIIAIALVLCAVFVPLAFVPGLSGQFYKQFAVTIAISTVISAFNSLTLSPALSAILLRSHDAPKDALTRGMDRVLGGFFRWFNGWFGRAQRSLRPRRRAHRAAQERGAGGLCGAARADGLRLHARAGRLRAGAGQAVPDRHRAVAGRRLAGPHRGGGARDEPHRAEGAGHHRFGGLPGAVDRRLLGRAQRRHHLLRPRALRRAPTPEHEQGRDPRARSTARSSRSRARACSSCRRRAVDGLGNAGGFKLQVQDRGGLGEQALYRRGVGHARARSTATRSRASARPSPPTTSTCRSCMPTSTAPAPSRWA